MFEITYNDNEIFENYQACQKAYKTGLYDFTFEDRFIIYHTKLRNQLDYLAIDKLTGKSSHVTTRHLDDVIEKAEYISMLRDILYSIKYTGDMRYRTIANEDPYELIETIFRVILPANGYVIREEQIKLSKTMFKGFTEKQVAICEAEVGTGKTLAYLVAAFVAKIYYERDHKTVCPVTISTATVELQRSLVEREIPHLSSLLEEYRIITRPFITTLRKGKEHYLCPVRLEALENDLKTNPEKHRDLLELLRKIRIKPSCIDLDKYAIRGSVKNRICVKGSCSRCKRQEDCCYNKMIRISSSSSLIDFQVTNHNMYLMSQKSRKSNAKGLLQKSCFVVVDEAHRVKEVAEDVFGESLSEKDIPTYVTGIKTYVADKSFSEEYNRLISRLLRENREMFSILRCEHANMETDRDQNAVINLSEMVIEKLCKMLNLVQEIELHKSKNRRGIIISGSRLAETLKLLIKTNKNITWINKDENDVMYLSCCPRNINKILWEKVWDCDCSHVLTSGTMSDGNDFEYFKKENGLDKALPRLVIESSTSSPFDYENNTRLYLPENMPMPVECGKEYIERISDEILNIIKATNGHTAILFTSYKVLQDVYRTLDGQLSDYQVFGMTRGNKRAIADFKKSKNGVLFASGSMWEGVDCVGDCLSSVIIVRLPFPLRGAITETKKKGYTSVQHFVDEYCVPSMLIKLRQGVGRLIRSETDTGLVSILDPRVTCKGYSDKVLYALEKYPVIDSIEEVENFFRDVKSEKYFM